MLKHISNVFFFSLVAQGIGFLRTLVIAALFGVSTPLDAYYLALIVPALVTGVVGGALQAGFVPVYVAQLSERASERAAALRGTIFWILILVLLLLSLATSVSAQYWTKWITLQAEGELQRLTVRASQIVLFSTLLNGIGDYLGLVLNCHRKFALAAAAPATNALVSIPALLIIGPSVEGLAWSLILGSAAQIAIVGLGVKAEKLTLPFHWSLAKGDVATVTQLARPILPGFVFTQLQLAYIQAMPARFGEGAVSIFGYATRLQSVVDQVFIVGIGTVLLPHLAELVAGRDREAISTLMAQVLRFTLIGAVLLQALIWLVGKDVIQLLLARGNFDQTDSAEVARLWLYLALATFPFALNMAFSKLIMAMGRSGILTVAAFGVLGVTYAMGNILPPAFGLLDVVVVVIAAQTVRLGVFLVPLGHIFSVGYSLFGQGVFVLKVLLVVAGATTAGKLALWSLSESSIVVTVAACAAFFSLTAAVGLWLTGIIPSSIKLWATR